MNYLMLLYLPYYNYRLSHLSLGCFSTDRIKNQPYVVPSLPSFVGRVINV